MNDFTLKELEYIAEAIEMWFKDYDSETPERIYLKVKSMIDSYCEHHKMQAMADENGHLFTKCTDCDHVSWHEKD